MIYQSDRKYVNSENWCAFNNAIVVQLTKIQNKLFQVEIIACLIIIQRNVAKSNFIGIWNARLSNRPNI